MLKSVYGHKPDVAEALFVADSAAIVGEVTLKKDVTVWYGAVLRADAAAIFVDEGSNIQDNVTLHSGPGLAVQIGKQVSVGHNAIVHGAVVEDGVLIGMHATIMNGCRIGTGSIIGAGTLLPQNTVIPPHSLVMGVPGKIVRTVTDAQLQDNLDNAARYILNGREHAKAPTSR